MSLVDGLVNNISDIQQEEDAEPLPSKIPRYDVVCDVGLSMPNMGDIPDRRTANKHVHPVRSDRREFVLPPRQRIVDSKLGRRRIHHGESLSHLLRIMQSSITDSSQSEACSDLTWLPRNEPSRTE